jgi:hypothetical protein
MNFRRYFGNAQIWSTFCLLLIALSLIGCASGKLFDVGKDDIPALKPDMGRIFVYRSFNPLAMLTPLIFKLNGKNIADTYSATIFYHDVEPGTHVINFTNGDPNFSFNVSKGNQVYIRYSVVSDSVAKGNVSVDLVNPKIALSELGNVRLIEKKIRFPEEVK